jgi:hypothetical protein
VIGFASLRSAALARLADLIAGLFRNWPARGVLNWSFHLSSQRLTA